MDGKMNFYRDYPLVSCNQAEENNDLEQIKKNNVWLVFACSKGWPVFIIFNSRYICFGVLNTFSTIVVFLFCGVGKMGDGDGLVLRVYFIKLD